MGGRNWTGTPLKGSTLEKGDAWHPHMALIMLAGLFGMKPIQGKILFLVSDKGEYGPQQLTIGYHEGLLV